MFKKYKHIERFGNDEVQGIELGTCHIFPKVDGTNASVWVGDDGGIKAGSRTRELTEEQDNAGFYAYILTGGHNIYNFLNDMPHLRLFGEWLVKHSLKTYRDDAWRKFYIFDVYDDNREVYLPYDEYKPLLDEYDLDYIPCMTVIKNATYDFLLHELESNGFLIKEGEGNGEGIVIKNYDYLNKFGRLEFAKIVTNTFKEKHQKVLGSSIKQGSKMVEQEIVDKYVDSFLINKVYAKIVNNRGGWNSKYIPRLLNSVYYDLVNEEIWNIVKKMKNPTINFQTLYSLIVLKVKEVKSELF